VKVNAETMHAMLPSIPQDFEQEMRQMIARMPEQRKEQPVMRRKISVGLVFALILLLITVSAVAAVLLGSKDFVEQIMAPKAAENKGEDRYTSAEVEEILSLAQENGIELPDHIIARLNANEDGEYKEELMRQFVKTEYGFYPSAWPLEVQHWYEVTMEACGQGDGHIANVLPKEGELTQEEAIAIVQQHIRETYGETGDLEDPERYLRHMTYTETIVNPYLTEREWYFNYEAHNPVDNVYYVTMAPDGEIMTSRFVAGVYGASKDMGGNTITARFSWAYGDGYGGTLWTTEILQEYQKALKYRVEKEGEEGIAAREKHALYQTYLTPDDSMITKEEAIAHALKACEGYEIYPGYEKFTLAVCLDTEEGPAWKVKLTLKRPENRMGRAYVEVDARTGTIKACDTSFESAPGWREIVSESYWEKNKPETEKTDNTANPRSTVRPDGRPGIWYSEIAPAWYWDKLDAVGYNGDTAGDLMNGWYNAYGEHSEFWPLEAQAINYIWHDLYPAFVTALPGLPSETDISQELAVKLARAAFEKEYAEALGETDIDMGKAVCGVSYWFNQPYQGVNCWEITLFTAKSEIIGSVLINAQTGEAEKLSNSWEGGFILVNPPTPAPSPTPSADGTPWFWGSDQFAPEYWERFQAAMDANGATFENIDEKLAEWEKAYKQDLKGADVYQFWPQELKAIYYMFHDFKTEADDREHIILPYENGVTEAQVKEIAWAEARRLCKTAGMEDEWIESLGISCCLWSDSWRTPGKSAWTVQFHEMGGEFNTRVWVTLDGETGEMIFSELDMKGNG